jgi:signal transduction histidine kinase
MVNLVTNAIQAMPEGGKLHIRAFQDGGDTVLTVGDTGCGIPKDASSKLFTPLFTTKAKGQGFGLAVVKRMTDALGGTVNFESELGKGTKFFIRLPKTKSN